MDASPTPPSAPAYEDLAPAATDLPHAFADQPAPSPAAQHTYRSPKKWLLLLAICGLLTTLDQLTKYWAHTRLKHSRPARVEVVQGYFKLIYVKNPGAAWGLLADSKPEFRKPFFFIVSSVAMLFILFLFVRLHVQQRLLIVALALILSGALGNFIDRIQLGYVVDFLHLHIKDRFHWPTFNVADMAITVGVALLLWDTIVAHRRRHPHHPPPAAPAG